MDDLNVNLCKLRNELGFTQQQMADELGMSRIAYIRLERGITRIINKHIAKAAKLGKMSIEKLVLGYDPNPEPVLALRDERKRNSAKEEMLKNKYESALAEKDKEILRLKETIAGQNDLINSLKEIISLIKRQDSIENE